MKFESCSYEGISICKTEATLVELLYTFYTYREYLLFVCKKKNTNVMMKRRDFNDNDVCMFTPKCSDNMNRERSDYFTMHLLSLKSNCISTREIAKRMLEFLIGRAKPIAWVRSKGIVKTIHQNKAQSGSV